MYMGRQVLDCLTELAQIRRRQQALNALLERCRKRLDEPLDQRIKRGKEQRPDFDLTREDWLRLHEQERARARERMSDLQLEMAQSKEQGTDLRRAMVRAKRVRNSGHLR